MPNTFNFTDIDTVLNNQEPTSTIKSGNGNSSFKNVTVLNSAGKYHAKLSYIIDKNTKMKIEDDAKLYALVGYTLTDEARETEEYVPMELPTLKATPKAKAS